MAFGDDLRAAAAAATAASPSGGIHISEQSMYPALINVLNELLPNSFEARVLSPGASSQGHPDIQIATRSGGAPVAHIEVKLSSTVNDVFRPDPATRLSQAQRYRMDDLPVWLTDAIRWWDISTSDDTSQQLATFADNDSTSDSASTEQLRASLHTICKVRPRFGRASAADAIAGVIARIDGAGDIPLQTGWDIVRTELGLTFDDLHLDAYGPGEIVTFTLLAIACELRTLSPRRFVDEASEEWSTELPRHDVARLPASLGSTLRLFRDEDRVRGGNLLGVDGWVTLRAIAAWITQPTNPADRWDRLSNLWDTRLHNTGRRKGLGSWQTHHGVAAFQASEVAAALRSLGYTGLGDPKVTTIDPSCGTGVYLQAVVEAAVAEGSPAGAFNAPPGGGFPRLLGIDISSTAVAAAHIRLSPTGARPNIYMTDTLAAGASIATQALFAAGASGANPVVAAARSDFEEVDRWTKRDPGREPILVVIGNPPYLRNGLRNERYAPFSWSTEIVANWRRGGGGRGVLDDLYVGFWAWAFSLMAQPIALKQVPFGVVSFISNRAWTHTKSFAPMRRWLAATECEIFVTDFGPSTRRGAASRWSDQPFDIETGTAITTVVFSPGADADVTYRRGHWANGTVDMDAPEKISRDQWINGRPYASLTEGLVTFPGVVTSDDKRWVAAAADRTRTTRYAYRPLDNRWVPHTPPPRAPRNRDPLPNEAKSSAYWRNETLWQPTAAHRNGGWYIVLPSTSSVPAPGPAVHATRHIMDMHLHAGDSGVVVPVGQGCPVPPGLVTGTTKYQNWAKQFNITGVDFWRYVLAAGNHIDYWDPDSALYADLEDVKLEPPLANNPSVIAHVQALGDELLDLWSLDTIQPIHHRQTRPGRWEFDRDDEARAITLHGRKVLDKWRAARPDPWDAHTATEYARSIAAILRIREIADEVAALLP